MFPSVKSTLVAIFAIAGLGSGLPCQAADLRYAYLEPALPVSLQALYLQTVTAHPLWQIGLAPGERQIVRLGELSLQEQDPFYWTRTRLDERKLLLRATLSLEIWRGPELAWQRTVSLERNLRLMGQELRGTGLAVLSPTAELPAGALSGQALRPGDGPRLARLQQDILNQAARQLVDDYRQHAHREKP